MQWRRQGGRPREDLRYTLTVDPSGGSAEAFTVTVVNPEGIGTDLRLVQDLVKGWTSHTRSISKAR
jgi:hypothetical protein